MGTPTEVQSSRMNRKNNLAAREPKKGEEKERPASGNVKQGCGRSIRPRRDEGSGVQPWLQHLWPALSSHQCQLRALDHASCTSRSIPESGTAQKRPPDRRAVGVRSGTEGNCSTQQFRRYLAFLDMDTLPFSLLHVEKPHLMFSSSTKGCG